MWTPDDNGYRAKFSITAVIAYYIIFFCCLDDNVTDIVCPILFLFSSVSISAWNVLVLGDEISADRFQEFAVPELSKSFNNKHDKRVAFFTSKYGVIPGIPYDAVIMAVDLRSLAVDVDHSKEVLKTAETLAVGHFGNSIYR